MCILKYMKSIPVTPHGTHHEPMGRGLSGEHIELCAEGARLLPNLSGKRTENTLVMFMGSPRRTAHFLGNQQKEGTRNVRKTY